MKDNLVHLPFIAIEDGHGARGSVRCGDRRAHDECRATLSGNHFGHVDDFPAAHGNDDVKLAPSFISKPRYALAAYLALKCQGSIRAPIQRAVGTIEPLPQHLAHEAVHKEQVVFAEHRRIPTYSPNNIDALQIVANRTPCSHFAPLSSGTATRPATRPQPNGPTVSGRAVHFLD